MFPIQNSPHRSYTIWLCWLCVFFCCLLTAFLTLTRITVRAPYTTEKWFLFGDNNNFRIRKTNKQKQIFVQRKIYTLIYMYTENQTHTRAGGQAGKHASTQWINKKNFNEKLSHAHGKGPQIINNVGKILCVFLFVLSDGIHTWCAVLLFSKNM